MRPLPICMLVLSLAFLAACGGNKAPEGTPVVPNPNDVGGTPPADATPTTTVVLDIEGMT